MSDPSAISVFKWISIRIGCHEAALKLLFSLLLGYPLCILYNFFLVKKSPQVKHVFFLSCGFLIGMFNYGVNILHTLATISIVFLLLNTLNGSRKAVAVIFIFCTSYLLWGYYKTQSDEYAFEWTIPQCVLTLRLISTAFDVYDGARKREYSKKRECGRKRECGDSKRQNQSAKEEEEEDISCSLSNQESLDSVPSFLQLLGHCYFPAAFLVGPQFGLHRYLQFVSMNQSFLSISVRPAFKCLGLGLLYLVSFQAGSLIFPPLYVTTPEFEGLEFWKKLALVAITCKIQLCKYICIWLIAEGSCIISGVTYDKNSDRFDTCSNVKVYEYETTSTFGGLIRSFNVSTNQWAAKYIFKRLKFLGSKFISHLCTLVFLAVWHGWKSGYYVTFTMEFLIMKMEWEVMGLVSQLRERYSSLDSFLRRPSMYWSIRIIFRLYVLVVFGYCLLPFILLTLPKWTRALAQLHYFGHVIYLPWILIGPFLIPILRPRKMVQNDDHSNKTQ